MSTIPVITSQALATTGLVRILVVNGKLVMPERSHTIYHPGNSQPGLPKQVAWCAWGLKSSQRIKITAKVQAGNSGKMSANEYELDTNNNPKFSGPATDAPFDGEKWTYTVSLYEDGSLRPIHEIDPDVHIDKDP